MYKFIFLLFCSFTVITANAQKTYTNPLLPSGADPWVIYQDGYYYYTNSTGHNITLWKTKNIVDLKSAEKKIVWTPPATGAFSKEIWAPEIHYLQGKWYVYFAADSGNNVDHRMYVIENASRDPLRGKWVMKGELNLPENKWAIDASVFENKGKLYVIWSGWKGDENGEQDIFIAQLENPWTAEGRRTLISAPTYQWETNGDLNNPNDVKHVSVNEGPEILKHGDKIFLIYSASGCWTDYYALGMLTASIDANLLNASSWQKTDHPVLNNHLKIVCTQPGIIHFLNHLMVRKIIFYIMRIMNRGRVVVDIVRRVRKNLSGMRMAHPTLESRLPQELSYQFLPARLLQTMQEKIRCLI